MKKTQLEISEQDAMTLMNALQKYISELILDKYGSPQLEIDAEIEKASITYKKIESINFNEVCDE